MLHQYLLFILGSGPIPKEVDAYLDKINCTVKINLPLPKEAIEQGLFSDCSDQPPNVQIDQVS